VKDILPTLERWARDGRRAAVATVVATERSAPRDPGASLAVNDAGEVAGSVTGGCVEPAVYEEARQVLAGEPARLKAYGIADETAFEVGLPCGGTVQIFVWPLAPELLQELGAAVRDERPVALLLPLDGAPPTLTYEHELLARGTTAIVNDAFVDGQSFAPRPDMYVFGAVDHAAALAEIGRFLGYRVTVCDARSRFVTPERFPNVDELVVEWPDRFLAGAHVDERTAICVLTHDHKFDIPLLKTALSTPAGYIGAMGSRRTTDERNELLRAEGVADDELVRIRAPIGLRIGARTPQEVAVAIAAELVQVMRERAAEAATAATISG
jgi:xanthine dehydrogenase accessory factor